MQANNFKGAACDINHDAEFCGSIPLNFVNLIQPQGILLVLGSMVDLTKLRQAQEDLQESNNTLRKINVDLDNFIYTASHDLKAPVTNLEGLITLLIPKLEHKLDKKELKAVNMIKLSVDKLNRTISGLLEITRIQKDLERNIDLLSFEEVLDEAKADVEQMIKDCGATIKTDFQAPELHYTRYNLKSILYNLLSNALKYCPKNRKPHIEIKTEQQGNYVLLTFSDNGMGMSQKQLEKLFLCSNAFTPKWKGRALVCIW